MAVGWQQPAQTQVCKHTHCQLALGDALADIVEVTGGAFGAACSSSVRGMRRDSGAYGWRRDSLSIFF